MEKHTILTTETGEQYFILGKNRIKITEHFPTDGKQLDELIADLVVLDNPPHLWYNIFVRKCITNVGAVSTKEDFYHETAHI